MDVERLLDRSHTDTRDGAGGDGRAGMRKKLKAGPRIAQGEEGDGVVVDVDVDAVNLKRSGGERVAHVQRRSPERR